MRIKVVFQSKHGIVESMFCRHMWQSLSFGMHSMQALWPQGLKTFNFFCSKQMVHSFRPSSWLSIFFNFSLSISTSSILLLSVVFASVFTGFFGGFFRIDGFATRKAMLVGTRPTAPSTRLPFIQSSLYSRFGLHILISEVITYKMKL